MIVDLTSEFHSHSEVSRNTVQVHEQSQFIEYSLRVLGDLLSVSLKLSSLQSLLQKSGKLTKQQGTINRGFISLKELLKETEKKIRKCLTIEVDVKGANRKTRQKFKMQIYRMFPTVQRTVREQDINAEQFQEFLRLVGLSEVQLVVVLVVNCGPGSDDGEETRVQRDLDWDGRDQRDLQEHGVHGQDAVIHGVEDRVEHRLYLRQCVVRQEEPIRDQLEGEEEQAVHNQSVRSNVRVRIYLHQHSALIILRSDIACHVFSQTLSCSHHIVQAMFQSLFKKKKPSTQDQPSKEDQFDQHLLKVIGWKNHTDIPNILMSFSDLTLWADKNSPSCLQQIKSHMILTSFSQMYNHNQELSMSVIQALILLLTNIKKEQFVSYIMGEQVMTLVLSKIPTDFQAVSYYVSLMKTISQRVNVDNVDKIVSEDGKCLLLDRCVQLYATDDCLAKTAILHIIFSFMRQKYEVLTPLFKNSNFKILYIRLASEIVQLFRQIDQVVLTLRNETMKTFVGMLQQVQDLLLYFIDLSKIQDSDVNAIVGTILYKFVILPILLSSLRIKGAGVISINLSVFLLAKLLPLVGYYNLQDRLYRDLLSTQSDHCFTFQTYSTGENEQHKLQYLEEVLGNKERPGVQIQSAEVRYTLFHLLTSKDDNLVAIVSHLIMKLFESTRVTSQVLIQCGVYLRIDQFNTNQTRRIMIPLLIKQLGSNFCINTLKNIASILVKLSVIKNDFVLEKDHQQMFYEVYRMVIDKARLVLKKAEHYEYIIQAFESDQKRVCQRILQTKQQIGPQAFLPPGEQNETLPFFERLPVNDKQSSRYDMTVFSLLRKLRYMLIKQTKLSPLETNFQKFYQSVLTSNASEYEPGKSYQIQGFLVLPCKIISNKFLISCYIIEDLFHFVIGVEQEGKFKIFINLRYKNIIPIIDQKAGTIKVKVRSYVSKQQRWTDQSELELKADSAMTQRIITNLLTRRDLCRQSELSFISKLLSKSESDIPKPPNKVEQVPKVQQSDLLNLN